MSKSVNKARVVGLYRVAVELVRLKCKVDVEASDYVKVSDYARNRSKTRDYGPRVCSVLSPVPSLRARRRSRHYEMRSLS